MASNEQPLLLMRHITKRFPGVLALNDVALELRRGEVLALVGENGAGKSSLMKILGGIHAADEGEVMLDGAAAQINSPKAARNLGIALIHQELMLAPNIDVAGNIFMGTEKRTWGPLKKLDQTAMRNGAAEVLKRVGLNVDPETKVEELTTGQMQLVEIAKALSQNARIIIMDEPTSSLTSGESQKLFEIIADLRAQGIAIIYISHRMDEIMRITDRITVLRDGQNAGELITKDANHEKIVSLMVGRQFSSWFPKRQKEPGEVLLRVENLRAPGTNTALTFDARRGEILGFAGLIGSGRTELMRVLFGIDQAASGTMELNGERFVPRRPADAIAHGIYLVPEDRKLHGLVLPMSIEQNISLPDIANYRPRWFLPRDKERKVAKSQSERLAIKAPTVEQKVVTLSGGNQQKVVLAKWLAMNPKILILDEPTRGIDVGAKAEIYRQIAELADAGITILMVSSEMEEVIGMSDRIIVMHERRISGSLDRAQSNEKAIMRLMTGIAA